MSSLCLTQFTQLPPLRKFITYSYDATQSEAKGAASWKNRDAEKWINGFNKLFIQWFCFSLFDACRLYNLTDNILLPWTMKVAIYWLADTFCWWFYGLLGRNMPEPWMTGPAGKHDPRHLHTQVIKQHQKNVTNVLCETVIPVFPFGYWICIKLSKWICNYDRCLTASYESWQYLKGWGCLFSAVCRQTSISWLDTPGYMVRDPIRILSFPLTPSCMCFWHTLLLLNGCKVRAILEEKLVLCS